MAFTLFFIQREAMEVEVRFETWKDCFETLPDPRVVGRTSHRLLDILFLTLCGVICGMDDWEAVEEWGQARLDWLRQFVPLENGIPSHDTLGRVFAVLDAAQFEACFVRWMSALCPSLEGEIVAIDGKTARRSYESDQAALHMVHAFVCGRGLTLGQWKTEEKSNEITALPVLIDSLDRAGATVTLDAMGCQKTVAQAIIDKGADYVLGLKGNQGTLYEAVCRLFDVAQWQNYAEFADWGHSTEEAGHGRIERRRCVAWLVRRANRSMLGPGYKAWSWLNRCARQKEASRQSGVTSSARCRRTRNDWRTRYAVTGKSRTGCIGVWI